MSNEPDRRGDPDSVILCATARSGSTLLCSLFETSGVAGVPDSWFRHESRAALIREWGLAPDTTPAEYLAAAKVAGATPNGVFGLRIMWPTLRELVAEWTPYHPGISEAALLERLFGRCRYIFLIRADTVAQAVSRLKAEQSGHWHTVGDWIEQKTPTPPGGLVYDAARIALYKREAEEGNAGWTRWFGQNGISPLTVYYDTLAADPPGTAISLLSALGLPCPPRASFPVENVRLADTVNRDWIARFQAKPRGCH